MGGGYAPARETMRKMNVFQKNWQELIKPQKLRVDAGHEQQRSATIVASIWGSSGTLA